MQRNSNNKNDNFPIKELPLCLQNKPNATQATSTETCRHPRRPNCLHNCTKRGASHRTDGGRGGRLTEAVVLLFIAEFPDPPALLEEAAKLASYQVVFQTN